MQFNPDRCALEGFVISCSGELTHEHIVRRGLGSKNKAAQKYLDKDMNIAMTCPAHNVGKLSDSAPARKIMLLQKIYAHGWTEVKEFYDAVPWKVTRYEDTLEAMLDAETRMKVR